MKVLGIIAEYDPFHRGHGRHLAMARERVCPDATVVVMSGCFKQRGSLALLSPHDRAACALAEGADAVLALPAAWTVRDAEHYALGGVNLLRRMGMTHLAFGAEAERLAPLRAAARLLENPDPDFRDGLRQRLDRGQGYPAALAEAVSARDGEAGRALAAPNNILAVCYLRALLRLGADMEPVMIPRRGAYHASRIDPEEPSASAVRSALRRGEYAPAFSALPEASRQAVRQAFLEGRIPREERLDPILIHLLRSMSRDQLGSVADVSEGLEDRILSAACLSRTRQELLDRASSRRYPRARISRILACALLGLTGEALRHTPLPETGVLLGLRKKPELTALWRARGFSPLTAPAEEPDLRAGALWETCAGLEAGALLRARVRTVP